MVKRLNHQTKYQKLFYESIGAGFGFASVTGKMYCTPGKGAAHMKTGETNDFREIVFDGTIIGNNMSGQYGIDNSSATTLMEHLP